MCSADEWRELVSEILHTSCNLPWVIADRLELTLSFSLAAAQTLVDTATEA